jgi:hypothetical protein
MWNNFFSKNSKWRIKQNSDFFLTNFLRCSNLFIDHSCQKKFLILIDILINDKKIKSIFANMKIQNGAQI